MRKVEDLHNKAADTRFVWFPFLWMKPKPNELLRFRNLVVMSILFGSYYGFFFTLRKALQVHLNFFDALPKSIGVAIAIFFVWFNLVTAPFWNRRARKLMNP